jgi:hypothetical protein
MRATMPGWSGAGADEARQRADLRHYHLPPAERRARFALAARAARARGHGVVLAGSMAQARAWGPMAPMARRRWWGRARAGCGW